MVVYIQVQTKFTGRSIGGFWNGPTASGAWRSGGTIARLEFLRKFIYNFVRLPRDNGERILDQTEVADE